MYQTLVILIVISLLVSIILHRECHLIHHLHFVFCTWHSRIVLWMFHRKRANAENKFENNFTAMMMGVLGYRNGKRAMTAMTNCLAWNDRDLSFSSSWPAQRSHIGKDVITRLKGHINEYMACKRAVRTWSAGNQKNLDMPYGKGLSVTMHT